jgi:hypothetical protein
MKKQATAAIFLALSLNALTVFGADDPTRLVPKPSCGTGWSIEGKPASYGKETLSDRIDGEAEIFFPYGFEYLAYGRYTKGDKAFDLDVYRMGSALDAFGMYANYRPDGADPLKVGTEGAVTGSQLFFYQDRYFVRLQSTGEGDAGKAALAVCAEAASRLLPKGEGAPREAQLLAIPEVEPGSVRYSATSLLGYDFLPRGLMADAVIAGQPARVFLLLAQTPSDAEKAFQSYRSYLQQSGGKVAKAGGGAALTGTDPLYGKAVFDQAGRYVYGFVRVNDVAAALPVLAKLRSRLGE